MILKGIWDVGMRQEIGRRCGRGKHLQKGTGEWKDNTDEKVDKKHHTRAVA